MSLTWTLLLTDHFRQEVKLLIRLLAQRHLKCKGPLRISCHLKDVGELKQ